MTMNPGNPLVEAITSNSEVLLSPYSTPAQIQAASAALASLSPPLSSLLPLTGLLSTPHAQIFHNLLRKQLHPSIYPTHSADLRKQLVDLSTSLLHQPTPNTFTLHASLAVREWPQNWPNFLPTLLSTPSACGVLAELSDAVLLHPGVSQKRSKDIIRALALSMHQILPVIISHLPTKHAWTAAEAFMGWVQVDHLFESGLVERVLNFLTDVHWEAAATAITALVERRVEGSEQPFRLLFKTFLGVIEGNHHIMNYLAMCRAPPGLMMPGLRPLWPRGGNVEGALHEFVERLFMLLTDLGVAHFVQCFMYSRRGVVNLDKADSVVPAAFIDLFLACLSHPATALRMVVLPFFTSILGNIHKSAHRSELVSYIATGYFHAVSAALMPGHVITEGFDDESEHETAVQNFLPRCTAFLTTAAKLQPSIAVEAFARMRGLFDRTSGSTDGVIIQPTQGHAWRFGDPPVGLWEECLESASTVADAVASGVTDERKDLISEMRACFEGVLKLSDPAMQSFRAYALRSFVALYRTDPSSLDRCVEVLGNLITQGKGRVRSRVCASLSVIFRRCGDQAGVGRYAGSLCEYCLRALGADFHTVEKIHLMEVTLTSVLALQSFEERQMYVERVLLPALEVLSKPEIAQVFMSPVSMYEFLDRASVEQAAPVVSTFLVLETSAHHLVRPVSKITGPIPLPGVLSRSVAPKGVDVACRLISCLHGMYNGEKFPVDTHADALHPTCREVTHLLNLETQKGIEQPAQGEKRGSFGEQRASETLLLHGVDPPDSTHSWLRETLRDLRKSAYEILRAAILSGVTQSPGHLKSLVEAVCSDFQYIEPLHLLLVITRVLHPLVSYPVVTAGPAYLQSLARSPIPALVRHIRQHVYACQKGETQFSPSATLDIARDHARWSIARIAADMLAAIYPRREPTKAEQDKDIPKYSPLVFKAGQLGVELALLWQTVCDPGQDGPDQGAARVGFALVVTAVEMAPLSEFAFFAPLLHKGLRTAVLNASVDTEDSPAQQAISAILTVMRKWPAESEQALQTLGEGDVHDWISEAVREVLNVKPKKQRTVIKALVERLAEVEGTKEDKREVQALSEKLVAFNPARLKNKPANELEEIVLGDTALDSLFGEGEPL